MNQLALHLSVPFFCQHQLKRHGSEDEACRLHYAIWDTVKLLLAKYKRKYYRISECDWSCEGHDPTRADVTPIALHAILVSCSIEHLTEACSTQVHDIGALLA